MNSCTDMGRNGVLYSTRFGNPNLLIGDLWQRSNLDRKAGEYLKEAFGLLMLYRKKEIEARHVRKLFLVRFYIFDSAGASRARECLKK